MPTGIEWTDETWNPVRGCTRVSAGCGGPGPHGGCYAEAVAARFSGPGQPYEGLAEFVTRPDGTRVPRWTGRLSFGHNIDLPLRWRRPRRIFVNSMSDLFHPEIGRGEIATVYAVAVAAHYLRGHTLQILTKRADRMRAVLADPEFWHQVNAEAGMHVMHGTDPLARRSDDARATMPDDFGPDNPPAGLWLGVSTEDQATADERIPLLMQTPAAIRFVSAEPLLGPIDLTRIAYPTIKYRTGVHYLDALRAGYWSPKPGFRPSQPGEPQTFFTNHGDLGRLSWVIAGGESGPRARPAHPDWFRALRDQCAAAGVRFFFKQWGEWEVALDREQIDPDWRADYTHALSDSRPDIAWLNLAGGHGFHGDRFCVMRRVGKRAAGRLLDGVEHNAFPRAA